MSAWKPTVFGPVHHLRAARRCASRCACRPSRSRLPRPAVRRSSSATSAAFRNVSAIFFVLPAGSFAQSAGLAAESMRITPYLRMPRSRSFLPISAGLAHLRHERLRVPRRCPSRSRRPSGGHTGATSEPTTRFFDAYLVGQPLDVVVGRIDVDVRVEEEQIDAVEFRAVDFGGGRHVRASCRDRWAARHPGRPCRRDPATSRCGWLDVCASLSSFACFPQRDVIRPRGRPV